jgi:hypothetical protein
MDFAKCPFERTAFKVSDGRNAALHNSAFGTVYPVVDGKPLPVCDHAGFAPFGFGYRRCPAEQFTIQVFEDFLRKVWESRIEFEKLAVAYPQQLPIGPGSTPHEANTMFHTRIVKKSKPSQNRGLSGGRVASGAVLRYPP